MSEALPEWSNLSALEASLHDAGAARFDAVAWHYIEVLSQRTRVQTGPAQDLLKNKLTHALAEFKLKMDQAPKVPHRTEASPSPLAALLGEMAQQLTTQPTAQTSRPTLFRTENPRVQQFKKQLNKISVQKQVTQAIALAPQNAGPINSHMLVLRSLSLMRDASPDYLNRFMTHVDTLLRLEATSKATASPKKSTSVMKVKK